MKTETLAADVDTSKECTVTNNTSSNAVIIMPTTAQTDNSGSAVSVYDQDLEILTTQEGGETINTGSSGTVVLDQSYKDPKTGQDTYSLIYNLLVSSSDWYYPMANLGVMQDIFSSPAKFDPQTASSDEQKAIANAALFYQTIQSYPTSQLAKNYQAAMSGAQTDAQSKADGSANSTANASNSITQSVNAFFAGTKQFQNVTLAGIVAVESYYNKFPFVWAQYKSTTYYLYSSNGSATSFIGQLALTQPSSIDVTKANSGYTCTFTPATDSSNLDSVSVDSSQSMNIIYSDGVFVSNLDQDIPVVAVKGSFQLKRLFTQKTTDTSVIPVITGSIDGLTVLGFDQPQIKSDKSSSDFWNTLFHPKNSKEVFESIMQLGGAIMMLHFFATSLYGMGKWLKNKLSGKETTTTEDDFKSQLDDFKKSMNDKIDEAVKKISDGKDSAPDNPEDAMDNIAEERGSVVDNLNAANLEDGLQAQADNLQELAEYESSMDGEQLKSLEENASSIQEANSALNNASQEDLGSVVKEQTSNLSDINENVGDLVEGLDSSLSAKSKEEIDANKAISEEASEQIKDANEDQAADESAEDPEAEDPIEPEL